MKLPYFLQCYLLGILNKRKRSIDQEKDFSVLLKDFSKVTDGLTRELIIAKLSSYGFSMSVLKLMSNCLTNYKQRRRINNSYRSREAFSLGYHKDLPVLFDTFLSDLLHFIDNIDFANNADDSTVY